MKNKTIISAKEYKEEYKRKRESKHISKDPEIKKRFGVFKVTQLLKEDDRKQFSGLYNYNQNILNDYMLPEEKLENEKKARDEIENEKQKKKLLNKEKDFEIIEDVSEKEDMKGMEDEEKAIDVSASFGHEVLVLDGR